MRCSHYWKLGLHEVCKYSYQAGKCSLSLSQHRNPSLILSRQVEITRFHFWPLSPPLFEYEMTICQISPSCLSPILGGNEIRVSQNPLPEQGHAPRPADEVSPAGPSLACDQQTYEECKRLGIKLPR